MDDEGAEEESWMKISDVFDMNREMMMNIPEPTQRRKQQRRRRWRRAY